VDRHKDCCSVLKVLGFLGPCLDVKPDKVKSFSFERRVSGY